MEKFRLVQSRTLSVEKAIAATTYEVPASALDQDTWSFATRVIDALIGKIKDQSTRLVAYSDGRICRGVVSGLTEAFVINSEIRDQLIFSNPEAHEIIKPFLNGRDIQRYRLTPKDLYMIYTYHGVNIDKHPAVKQYLRSFKDQLLKRATRQEWYELQQPQYAYKEYFESPKIIFPDIATAPRFVLDEEGYYGSNTIYFIPMKDLYLLGLLNSKLGYFYFRTVCAGLEGAGETYLRFFGQYLEGFPVKIINLSDLQEKGRHDKLVSMVDRMLKLQKRHPRTPQDEEIMKREIESTDKKIDNLVYELYGLTDDEVRIVERK